MLQETIICPYTGLRPFTEEESLYFKGRDEHVDQATQQLARNKFIMLTGASGDGKSSLVYAGIIPNAKAGFLKSQFTNWTIADFRPERDPFGNLCHALSKQLNIPNENTVRTELSHGFSALVDVYKSSSFYTDTKDDEWNSLDTEQKNLRKRQASNLIIIADQFEEFFTNPENFHKGVPSQDASLVTNLLLETARIALEENLPIYVIITMRSDFIGQCASFRGLPEAIGFSQFFVPRLNRSQLQEVIEEPATLSGCKISRRLTERLIHDMVEGTDQLPILQHALNQIWKMADEGQAEMDLFHYAMVGGMKGEDLPEVDRNRFQLWFNALPEKIRECYSQPDLQNVLNTHANKLYNSFGDLQHEAQVIIETAFKCLTKIDNSRPVRNRMTLGEITAIINQPHLDFLKVGKVLTVFRDPGNTLLRPFTEELPRLDENTVLDITHESLIRNWENLAQWAKEEFNSYTIYLDFNQQLSRWIESKKSNSFLLYIGPLTYFENWFSKVKPNTGWIARYLGDELNEQQRKEKASAILSHANEFLHRSAKKHAVTRTVMKYGPRKIAAVLGLIALVTLSSLAFKTYLDRRNPSMIKTIQEEAVPLLNSSKISYSSKAAFVAEQLRLNITTLPDVLAEINDPLQKLDFTNGLALCLVYEGRNQPAREIAQAISTADSLFSSFDAAHANAKDLSYYLKTATEWRSTLGLAYFYNSSGELLALQQKNGRRMAALTMAILNSPPAGFTDILDFSIALETALNFNGFSKEELLKVTSMLSSLEPGDKSDWVKHNFKKDQLLLRGYQGYGFNFNGLYQEMAYLYAAQGEVEKSLRSIDTLLKYNEPYYQRDYTNLLDNASNIASVYYRSGHVENLDAFVAGYCERKKITELEFYQRLLGRSQPYQLTRNSLYSNFWNESSNVNLQYNEPGEIAFFFEKFREVASRLTNPDEKNFQLAIAYKHQGITLAHKSEVVKDNFDTLKVKDLFAKSIVHYQKVSKKYLAEIIERVGTGADVTASTRNALYLLPDVNTQFSPLGSRDFHWNFMSTCFMEYLIDQGLFDALYEDPKDLKLIESWLTDYHYHAMAGDIFMRHHAAFSSLEKIAAAFQKRNLQDKMDLNLLYLYLGYYAYQQDDQSLALKYYTSVKPENFNNLLQYKILTGYTTSNSFKLMASAFTCFSENNQQAEAKKILDFFKKPANRSSMYAFAAREFVEKKKDPLIIQLFLDSAIVEMGRTENLNSDQPNRFRVAVTLVTQSPTDQSIGQAQNIIKNQTLKFIVLQRMARGIAYNQELYKASNMIPDNISDNDIMEFLRNILIGYAESQTLRGEWKEYQDSGFWFDRTEYTPYVNESN